MRKRNIFKVYILVAALALLIFLNIFAFNGLLTRTLVSAIRWPVGVLVARTGFIQHWTQAVVDWRELTRQNEILTSENLELKSRLVRLEHVKDQNASLRRAANLPDWSGYKRIDGTIFSYQTLPDGMHLLVNRGSADGIDTGDIVISMDSVLLGIIVEVMPHYSVASVVTAPEFKATVTSLGRGINALARGALGEGVKLDLVGLDENLQVGDTIATDGHDTFPPGLIIGTVSRIERKDSEIFKQIWVQPSQTHTVSDILILQR